MFNFKKIASVLASAVMLGSTLGIAAAANYPAPFVAGGAADVAVIVGASAASSDYLGAVDLGTNLQLELAKQTASSSSSTASISGEGIALSSGNTKIYYNDSINKVTSRATLDKSELPVVLADGEVTDDSGTDYDYTQKIGLNQKYVAWGTSGADINDPTLYVDMGTTIAQAVYNMTVSFTKTMNLTHSDVRGNAIGIFGKDYTIGSTSLSDTDAVAKLILYGAGNTITLNEGDETTVTVGGVEYTIQLVGISSTEVTSVSVDGGTVKEISEGSSSKIGDLHIYAKSAFYSAKETSQNYAELSLGSDKLTLENGKSVKAGSEDKSVQNTLVNITTSGGKISTLRIDVTAQKSKLDDIRIGNSYTDPVFGTFKIDFASISEDLKADTRDHINIDTDNTANAYVTFDSALADIVTNFNWVHDSDTASTTARPVLADASNKTIHVLENSTVREDEYIVVNSGDDGRILELAEISITAGGDPDDYVTFTDALTNTDYKSIGNFSAGTQTLSIGGEDYTITANATRALVKWNTGANLALFPRIKLEKGGWIAFLTETTIVNATTYIMPSGYSTVTSDTLNFANSTGHGAGGTVNTQTTTYSNWNWTYVTNATTMNGLDIDNDGTVECNFSLMKGPALLLIEEKKDGDTYGDGVCVPLTTTGTTELAIDTPHFSDVSGEAVGLVTWTSDTYTSSGIDSYGTYVEKNTATGTNQLVDIYYPDEQVEMNIMIGEVESSLTGGTVSSDVTNIGSITYKDDEVSSVSSRNLIVVGGSCINTVAAKILGSDTPMCGEDFTTATDVGAGQFLIKAAESPYNAEKTALLVAGYDAADTTKAVEYVTKEVTATNPLATDVGTELKKVSSTYADVASA